MSQNKLSSVDYNEPPRAGGLSILPAAASPSDALPSASHLHHPQAGSDSGELLSALVDGQLAREDFAIVSKACGQDVSTAQRWSTYHLIGDVLRSPGAPVQVADAAFISRLSLRLAQELEQQQVPKMPAIYPVPEAASGSQSIKSAAVVHHGEPAANEGVFRWKVVAGVASLAAVSAMAWSSASFLAPTAAPQLAQSQPTAPQIFVASPQGLIVRDARFEELLAAHRQWGGASLLEAPSSFLRNATYDTQPSAGP